MHVRLAEIGHARGIGGDFVANALELASANVLKILARGRGGGGLVEIDRNLETLPDFGSHMPRHRHAIFESNTVNRDERNHVGCAHPRVRALVARQINQLGGLAHTANHGFLNRLPAHRPT